MICLSMDKSSKEWILVPSINEVAFAMYVMTPKKLSFFVLKKTIIFVFYLYL